MSNGNHEAAMDAVSDDTREIPEDIKDMEESLEDVELLKKIDT